MDFALTAEQKTLRDETESFARDRLNDDIIDRDRQGRFSTEGWQACAEQGILSMSVDAEYNTTGTATDPLTGAIVMEALGKGCRDNGLVLALATQMWTVQYPIGRFGNEAQKQTYLPAMSAGTMIGAHATTEEGAGSDHLALSTSAERHGEGYLLTGTKKFVTLGPIADVALVFATVDADKGRWGVTAFIVDLESDGCTRVPREKMGLRTAPMGDLVFDGCFVPESNRLGPEGAGASISSESLAVERCFVLAAQVGAMQRQLEESIDFARNRSQFGKPIGQFQSVSNRIVDMRLLVETGQLLLYKTAWMLARGESITMESALLKLHLAESFVTTSLDYIRTHGGVGYLTENEVERDLRDAVGGVIYAGTSDIQRVLAARILGL